MKAQFHYETPIGTICIRENGVAITALYLETQPKAQWDTNTEIETDLLRETNEQLKEYFSGERKQFSVPVLPEGTTFQQKVWKALQEIPYGNTQSYGELAKTIGCPKGARAVGSANHCNPIIILIPCHRVIGANGHLTGFACGLDVKQYLLNLEKHNN